MTEQPPAHLMTGDMGLLVFVMAIVFAGLWLTFRTRRKIDQKRAAHGEGWEQIERLRKEAMARQDAQHAAADLHDVAAGYSAQLAVQAARLEVLISQADQRLLQWRTIAESNSPGDVICDRQES